jgi:hypothetical protein
MGKIYKIIVIQGFLFFYPSTNNNFTLSKRIKILEELRKNMIYLSKEKKFISFNKER